MFNSNNNQFYPTPERLIRKMLRKIESFKGVKYILEPSAGKGDLLEGFINQYKSKTYLSSKVNINEYIVIDAIEIDYNLSCLLRGKGFNVVYDDFLDFKPQRYYDLIVMNPPFINGAEHLLKAIEIQERLGGKVLCILNAETLKNAYSSNRKNLLNLLEKYNASIEYLENEFLDAERKTLVEVALISIDVPMLDNKTIFEKEFFRDNPTLEVDSIMSLSVNKNKLEQLIFECELIKKSGENLFLEKLKIDRLLNGMGISSKLDICKGDYSREGVTINDFIDNINLDYWKKFIRETDFQNRLPSKLRENFDYNMERQKNIAFNMENVRYFYEELVKSIPQSYEEAVAKVFDDVTRKYVYTENAWNKTIHYYNGWKTNKASKVNKKVIIPMKTYWMYSLPEALIDLNIIFENISGYKDNIATDNELIDAIKKHGKKIETKFFILDSYIKGTLHITFKDEKLLNQFNILAAKGKMWLPGDFGVKSYSEMNSEEKELVKNFGMTPTEYNNSLQYREYIKLIA